MTLGSTIGGALLAVFTELTNLPLQALCYYGYTYCTHLPLQALYILWLHLLSTPTYRCRPSRAVSPRWRTIARRRRTTTRSP